MTDTFYGPDFELLSTQDPDIAAVLLAELHRQQTNLQLIASENFTSRAVLAAMGSTLSNKYAEGYPGKRYYGGCEEVDVAEIIAIERAKSLFGAEHANVQPHSGASANVAVYQAFTKPGDTVLAMSLPHGGHLTHGSKVNFSGKWFNVVSYGVRQDNELIDYDELRDSAIANKPKMICSGATAYPSLIDFEKVRAICDEVGAIMWVDAAHFIGLVAGKAIPSPVPYADVVSFTTHKVWAARGEHRSCWLLWRCAARALGGSGGGWLRRSRLRRWLSCRLGCRLGYGLRRWLRGGLRGGLRLCRRLGAATNEPGE